MSQELPQPRLAPELKREIVRRIIACNDEAEAGRIAERLWAALRGDMQDRITSFIYAVKGALDATDMNTRRDSLKRALKMLDGKEIAATEIPAPRRRGRRRS